MNFIVFLFGVDCESSFLRFVFFVIFVFSPYYFSPLYSLYTFYGAFCLFRSENIMVCDRVMFKKCNFMIVDANLIFVRNVMLIYIGYSEAKCISKWHHSSSYTPRPLDLQWTSRSAPPWRLEVS